ncbi:MAG: peptidoglycan-binding protein [Pyrinomonadaceae bacterium]|nr:peptidoglycan-binding protein [Pyrinomonadaceae bacterium]
MDKNAEKLKKVHPELASRITKLIAALGNLGLTVVVTDGLRTFDEQNKLFAKGRTAPGQIVTKARGGQSNHNYGLAVDLCPFENGRLNYDNLQNFNLIGREAKKLGLEWGGDWKFTDKPHVQLKGMSVKECFAAYSKGGLTAVWQRMDNILRGAKPAVFTPAADDILEFGDIGGAVRKLQADLASLGYLHAHEIDGEFGKITKNAVIGFQRQNGLTADGIVGDGTKARLAQKIAEKNTFAHLQSAEIKLDIPQINQTVSAAEPIINIPTESIGNLSVQPADVDLSATIPAQFPPPFSGSLQKVENQISNTVETVQGTVEQTTTLTENVFDPKNIPAFIPRFGWQKYLALVPFGSFLTFIVSWFKSASWVAQLSIGIITGAAVFGFFLLIYKHREFVGSFVLNCYKAMADPNSHNLIPTNPDDVDSRQNELVSSLNK